MHKHCVPQQRHAEIIGANDNICAWDLARPLRYVPSISYTRTPGQVIWVDDVRFLNQCADDTAPQALPDDQPTPDAEATHAAKSSGIESLVRTRVQAAAAAVETRAL